MAQVDCALARNRLRPFSHRRSTRYPGENTALVVGVVGCVVVILILGLFSLGLFFVVLAFGILQLRASQISIRNSSRPVSDRNDKQIHELSKIAAFRLYLPAPEVYVRRHAGWSAFTAGFYRSGYIVLGADLVKHLTPEEILFVIGHELGHVKHYHTTFLNLISPAERGGSAVFVGYILRFALNLWSIKAEYTADQAGLLAAQDVKAATSTMKKLSGDGDDESVGAEARETARDSENEQAKLTQDLWEYFGTHPFISNRIRQLKTFSESSPYSRYVSEHRARYSV